MKKNNHTHFITIEGVDGAGKTTHVAALVNYLKNFSEVVHTREPGGTPIAENLRSIALESKENIDPVTETMLMFTARKDHISKVIEPALSRGAFVVCDRFTDSSWAYQGGGKGVPFDTLAALEKMTHEHLQPGLTFLFDLPVELSLERLKKTDKVPDRFESQPRDFFHQVRQTYLQRAKLFSDRFIIIDSSQPIEVIAETMKNHIQTYLSSIEVTDLMDVKKIKKFNK